MAAPFPQNIIVIAKSLDDAVNWERFTSADDKYIIGAGSTYSAGDSGGNSKTGSISRGSSTNGAHIGSSDVFASFYGQNAGAYVSWAIRDHGSSAGGHAHTVTADYEQEYQQLLLIKAKSDQTSLPSNAVVLYNGATTPISGLTICYNENKALRSGASVANGGGGASNWACSSAGTHSHPSNIYTYYGNGGTTTGYAYNTYGSAEGAHTHSIASSSLTDTDLKRTYLTAWSDTSGFAGAPGIIAMWEGSTAPSGWVLCDGNNGTLDLQDYFIMLSDVSNVGDQYNETNRIQTNITLSDSSWSHDHKGSLISDGDDILGDYGGYHDTYSATHGHTIGSGWNNYTPEYYALTFIQMASWANNAILLGANF